MEREGTGGTKRDASNIPSPTSAIKSPLRRQRIQHPPELDTLITQEGEPNHDTQTTSFEMDHSPTQSNKPSQNTANAIEHERAEKGGER